MLLKIRNLTLEFKILSHNAKSIKNSFLKNIGGLFSKNSLDNSYKVTALSNLNLEIDKDEKIGLIGHNGAGKTTLLRVLSGVYKPTLGSVEINGKVLSLINLLNGFDETATGYENIYLKSILLGINLKDIKNNIVFVEEFSELGDFLNLPLRTYSSGMKLRLAFSIVMTVDFDILLLDEWLSVGDKSFQNKAEKLLKKKIKNKALVLASHSEDLIRSLCTKIIMIKHGEIVEVNNV